MPTATPLTNKTKPDGFVFPRLILWLALVPAFVCLYIALTYAMMRIGQTQSVEERDNPLLEAAAKMAPFSPHIQASMARFEREWALQTSGEQSQLYWQRSMASWQRAMNARPDWPFYELGMLDVEILSGQDAEVVSARFQRLITLAPNERAKDERLLSLAFSGWHLLTEEQHKWVWMRLRDTPGQAFYAVGKVADEAGLKSLFCAKTPWVRAKSVCIEGKRRPASAKTIPLSDLKF